MFPILARCTARAPRSLHAFSIRAYATKPLKPRQPILPKTPTASRTSVGNTAYAPDLATVQLRRKYVLADKLFTEGRTLLFQRGSHKGLLVTCYGITAAAFASVAYIYHTDLWHQESVIKRGLHWTISSAYGLTMVFMAFLGGFALSQSFFFCNAIKLVKDRGELKFLVTERRLLPLLRAKQYVVPLNKVTMERGVIGYIENPYYSEVGELANLTAEVGNIFKRIVIMPFLIFRKLFLHEGVINFSVNTGEKERQLRIDVDGKFSNGGKDLIDLAEVKQD